jgi:hypothetical protein
MSAHLPTTRHLLASLALLALLLAACADGTAVGGSAPATEPASEPATAPGTQPATQPATEPATEPASEPAAAPATDPATEPVAYEEVAIVPVEGTPRRVRWAHAEVLEDGTRIAVQWWSGVEPCSALADVTVEETDTAVTITVFEASTHPDDADVACIEIAMAKQHTVTLAAPLGSRDIVDGTDG